MKKTNRILACLLLCLLCVGLSVPAFAGTCASDYLTGYDVWCSQGGDNEVVVEFSVEATDIMDYVGVTLIRFQVYSGGSWSTVHTKVGSVANGLLSSNVDYHAGTYSYTSATTGQTYRALVTVYAADGSGSDSRTVTSNSVVAP